MTKHPYDIDPATGLPQLDENHAFKVVKTGYSLTQHDLGVEIHRDTKPIYGVSIVELKPISFFPAEPLYTEKQWGPFKWKVSNGYADPIQKPREEKEYATVWYHELIDIYMPDQVPEELLTESVKNRYNDKKIWLRKHGIDTKKMFYFNVLDLNEENILQGAIKAFQGWETDKQERHALEKKRLEERTFADKFIGLYPPKGLNNRD